MDQKTALELFEYRDGKLYWRAKINSRAPIGSEAGSYNARINRRCVKVYGKRYYSYKLIFLMHHGYMPCEIDHIDTDSNNNRIENLRGATRAQNLRNRRLQSNNTSGCKNVVWKSGKWVVELKLDGQRKYLGRFQDLELAHLVASEALDRYHGEFARHG